LYKVEQVEKKMRNIACIVFVLFIGTVAGAQNPSVNRKIFQAGTPNFFFESISIITNEVTGLSLCTWEKHPGNHPGHETLSRKITAGGKPKGKTNVLISSTNTYEPSLIYNRNRNEFALAYADEVGGQLHAIYIRALDSTGRRKGNAVKVSTDSGPGFVNQHPRFAYDAVNRVYVVFWTRSSTMPGGGSIPGEGIYAAILDEAFTTITGPVLILGPLTDPALPKFPDILDVAIGPSEKILIGYSVFLSTNPSKNNYFVASLNEDLSGLSIARLNGTPVRTIIPDLHFASLPTNLLVFYVDTNGIRKKTISATGSPSGKRTAAFGAPLQKRKLLLPVIATVQNPQGPVAAIFIAMEDPGQLAGNGTIWGQTLDETGNPLGTPFVLDTNFRAAHFPAAVVLPSSTAAVTKFSVLYSDGGQISLPPQGEFSQIIELLVTIPAF